MDAKRVEMSRQPLLLAIVTDRFSSEIAREIGPPPITSKSFGMALFKNDPSFGHPVDTSV